jgi:aminoglycoside 6'-N-acetyltransferase
MSDTTVDLPMLDGTTARGLAFRLRPLTPDDLATLGRVLADPTVARWWGNYDEARVREEYLEPEDAVFLVEVGSEAAGMIQYGEELSADYKHASIDIAMREAYQGQGLGPAAIRAIARHLFGPRGHHRITIDPAAANRNAIRAYASVGFKPVGLMRQYERGPDGSWHDGLLMDLLRDELIEA